MNDMFVNIKYVCYLKKILTVSQYVRNLSLPFQQSFSIIKCQHNN